MYVGIRPNLCCGTDKRKHQVVYTCALALKEIKTAGVKDAPGRWSSGCFVGCTGTGVWVQVAMADYCGGLLPAGRYCQPCLAGWLRRLTMQVCSCSLQAVSCPAAIAMEENTQHICRSLVTCWAPHQCCHADNKHVDAARGTDIQQ
jgi:hypothetical protein